MVETTYHNGIPYLSMSSIISTHRHILGGAMVLSFMYMFMNPLWFVQRCSRWLLSIVGRLWGFMAAARSLPVIPSVARSRPMTWSPVVVARWSGSRRWSMAIVASWPVWPLSFTATVSPRSMLRIVLWPMWISVTISMRMLPTLVRGRGRSISISGVWTWWMCHE